MLRATDPNVRLSAWLAGGLLLAAGQASCNAQASKPAASRPSVSVPSTGVVVELGAVRWERDLDAGLRRSAAESKPALLLFQEVPG